ncbi:hypothetical protein ACH5RR_012748 [Cinchona calisaya]|uniref:Uncharacterized protein n=1 Tax=Cinchona calisaya TaxID=153742 RepID=A0ABD3AC75_9GENT
MASQEAKGVEHETREEEQVGELHGQSKTVGKEVLNLVTSAENFQDGRNLVTAAVMLEDMIDTQTCSKEDKMSNSKDKPPRNVDELMHLNSNKGKDV